MLTELFAALDSAGKVAYELLHKSKQEQINDAFNEAKHDCETFKKALLEKNDAFALSALNGLVCGIDINLTASEAGTLAGQHFRVDGLALVGWYCRARASRFQQIAREIVQQADEK